MEFSTSVLPQATSNWMYHVISCVVRVALETWGPLDPWRGSHTVRRGRLSCGPLAVLAHSPGGGSSSSVTSGKESIVHQGCIYRYVICTSMTYRYYLYIIITHNYTYVYTKKKHYHTLSILHIKNNELRIHGCINNRSTTVAPEKFNMI